MKTAFLKNPYASTAAVFVAVLAVGRLFWGWASLATAFFLLLYCIVAVAIKLDEIVQRLDGISRRLDRLTAAAVRKDGSDGGADAGSDAP